MTVFVPPDEGLCVVCEETVALRRDGRTVKHPRPQDPDSPVVFTLDRGRPVADTHCLGTGQHPAARLDMTFARWLRAHHKRRDHRDKPVTFLAQWVFKPCTRTAAKTVTELTWATPDELRLHLLRPGVNGWLAGYIDAAEASYEAYLAEAEVRG